MEKVYIVYLDYLGHENEIGYVGTEAEAIQYCDWKNQYVRPGYEEYRYREQVRLNLEQEMKEKEVFYFLSISHEHEIEESYAKMVLKSANKKDSYELHLIDGESVYDFYFQIKAENEEIAKAKAFEIIDKMETAYQELEDWDMAAETVGGFVTD